jgi:hypothetical protein
MNQVAGQQQAFFNELQGAYGTAFSESQNILSNLTSGLTSIFQAGPNQSGFSAAQNTALQNQAINNSATAYRNAAQVAGAQAGGNTGTGTGAQAALQSQIAATTGAGLSSNLNQINLANAQTGRENYWNAASALGGTANMLNPNQFANSANVAGKQAYGDVYLNNQANSQMQADLGGVFGGAAMSALSGFSQGSGPFGFLGNFNPRGTGS